MGYLDDHWTTEIHQLGYEGFAASVRQLILEVPTPFALSISGRWGAGKTSMLRTLMRSLGGKPLAVRADLTDTEEPTPNASSFSSRRRSSSSSASRAAATAAGW